MGPSHAPILEYGDGRDDARGRRWALASLLVVPV